MAEEQPKKNEHMHMKISDDVLKGAYSNSMQVSHTKEEFVMDFMTAFPPQGIVNARIITSPAHVKRIIRALSENLTKYESQFGQIQESQMPPMQFREE